MPNQEEYLEVRRGPMNGRQRIGGEWTTPEKERHKPMEASARSPGSIYIPPQEGLWISLLY